MDPLRREGGQGHGADRGAGMSDGPGLMAVADWWLMLPVALAAAAISAIVIRLIRPQLLKHALAKPNARSSHQIPTPQGAGIAVIAATLVIAGLALAYVADTGFPVVLFAATLFMAALGFADDIKPVPVLPRLLVLAGLWFVNLVNFMDGLDWMTVAEAVPITAALALLGLFGELPPTATLVAAALCGAMIGFAPFNRPVASIFLGDVGSLPIGLLLGWCLLQLAWHHHLAAALLLPLYYLADASVTLLRRLMRREPFWIAHRSHFYQRATDNGFTGMQVVSEVVTLNLALAALAAFSIKAPTSAATALLVALGAAAVGSTMFRFSRPR